ncbi:MAG: uracil-DNA glycosylase [Actinomycetota bacterium]|nr:uracil-DNA glycosylase [Actinomycetota bacterium]MDQ3953025.1 uracil-DNA glycosylase [Actinomycetota bacterium]
METESLARLAGEVAACRACPRLVAWREKAAREKRAAYRDEEYWGRPLPGYGGAAARILVVGLAPAAHGGNRTGRIFTGDRSGDWLFASMFRQGLTNQPHSVHAGDGLTLHGAYVAAAVRCAPPDNKPATDERDRCLPYLVREARLLRELQVVVALGGFAWDAWLRVARTLGFATPRPKPRFGHLQEATVGPHTLLGSYHPSQQNTFTGRLTEEMLDAVFARARALSELPEVTR